jgi:hypothetical protein
VQGASVLVVILAGLSAQYTSSEDVLRLTNVTINMSKHFSRNAIRIEARITNPDDFAVYDVVADCYVKGRRGSSVSSFTLTVTDAIQANGTRIIRDLDIDAGRKEGDVKSLHAKIGELTLENDFLEGALTKAGLLSAKR